MRGLTSLVVSVQLLVDNVGVNVDDKVRNRPPSSGVLLSKTQLLNKLASIEEMELFNTPQVPYPDHSTAATSAVPQDHT